MAYTRRRAYVVHPLAEAYKPNNLENFIAIITLEMFLFGVPICLRGSRDKQGSCCGGNTSDGSISNRLVFLFSGGLQFEITRPGMRNGRMAYSKDRKLVLIYRNIFIMSELLI